MIEGVKIVRAVPIHSVAWWAKDIPRSSAFPWDGTFETGMHDHTMKHYDERNVCYLLLQSFFRLDSAVGTLV